MLRKTEMSRLEDAKNFERKDAASKLDLLIKKTYYNIENVSLQNTLQRYSGYLLAVDWDAKKFYSQQISCYVI